MGARIVAVLLVVLAGSPVRAQQDRAVANTCSFSSEPTVVKSEGNSVLQYWIEPYRRVFDSAELPRDPAFAEYRTAIRRANTDLRRPVADPPQPANNAERQMWRDEDRNVEVAFSGDAGTVRPVQCLDALLFTYQNARYDQLTHPTEFIVSVLRKEISGQTTLKIFFGAGDEMFPPRGFYGFDELERDLSDGWEFWVALHNHTIRSYDGAPALGVPAPSTSDVDLMRSLATEKGLQNAWVTNGFYTVEIPAEAFSQYVGRRQRE